MLSTNLPLFKLPFHLPFSHSTPHKLPQKFHSSSPNNTKRSKPKLTPSSISIESIFLLESILIEAAGGTDEVLGKVFPSCAGGNAVVGISLGGIVFIATGAYVFHSVSFLPL